MSAIYILWLRELKEIFKIENANHCIVGPATAVFAGAGIRAGAGVSEGRRRELSSVHGAGSNRDDGAIYFRVFRDCAAVGPAIWISKRNACCARAAHPGHDWENAGRDHGGIDSGNADLRGVRHCRVPAGKFAGRTAWICFHGADRVRFRGAGNGDRVEPARHAGFPTDHEFSGASDFLFIGCAISAEQSAKSAIDHHPP